MSKFSSALQTFFQECEEHLNSLDLALVDLTGNEYQSKLKKVLGILHSIKGSAGVFQLTNIVNLCHSIESVATPHFENHLSHTKEFEEYLYTSFDLLRQALSDVIEGKEDTSQFIEQCEEVRQNLQSNEQGSASDKSLTWEIKITPNEGLLEQGYEPINCINYLKNMGEINNLAISFDRLKFADNFVPTNCYLTYQFELVCDANKQEIYDSLFVLSHECVITISLSQLNANLIEENYLKHATPSTPLLSSLLNLNLITDSEHKKAINVAKTDVEADVLSTLVKMGAISQYYVDNLVNKSRKVSTTQSLKKTLRIDANKLDRLIDEVGEMVIIGARTNLLAHKIGDPNLIEAMSLLERLVENIRDSSLQLRMVQIGDTFNKFHRIVRDLSNELGKSAQLIVEGGETELDKTFVEKLSDPLVHLIRNALDHGIETKEQRVNSGKPETATIKLSSFHESGSIVITISDDGYGLDLDEIKRRAITQNLINESSSLSDKEISQLIFEPGFSTSKKITSLSGRGIGMDVVKQNIDSLRGTIEIETVKGKGTEISIRLPLTLSIIDGFMFDVANQTYVIPLDNVVECLELCEVTTESEIAAKDYINLRGEILPFIRLRKLFGINKDIPFKQRSIIVARFGSLKAGLLVDTLKGELQTVVKPLGDLFAGMQGISGATIIGSGEVAIILDVATLIKTAMMSYEQNRATGSI